MRVVDRKTVMQNMGGETRTIQNFGQFLGEKPHKLGQVITMYPQHSLANLTDALKNVYINPKSSGSSFAPINSMAIEWDIDVNFIKRVRIATSVGGTPVGKEVFNLELEERYYDKNDTFALENRQMLFVVAPPIKLGDMRWQYRVVLTGDGQKSVDVAFLQKGRQTRYRSNYFPELSERGYTKFISNTETHRNFISRHRAGVDWSADYAIREELYIEMGKGKKEDRTYFKLNKKEKECLDHFLASREASNLFSISNFDVNGKCQDQDEKGRDIPMGDGVIPQIERYCDKFAYSNLTTDIFEDVMASMIEKAAKPTGNVFAVVCNERMYTQVGRLLANDLRFRVPGDGSYFFSKEGGKVKVGAEFDSYTFQGNTITFMVNRALSQEYEQYGYGIFLDISGDTTSGRPNIASFTLEGSEMISGSLNGMGGQNGKTSGDISTPVHGSSYHLIGYSGTVVFNPYQSFILEESVTLF
jgi:hypothetical protein